MGDRVLVTFTDDNETFTPAVYMHNHGSEAAQMIKASAPKMRAGDASYSVARFCGECHLAISGVLGLGIMPAPVGVDGESIDWEEYSHGDAGVYIVNVTTGKVDAKGGFGKAFKIDPKLFGQD